MKARVVAWIYGVRVSEGMGINSIEGGGPRLSWRAEGLSARVENPEPEEISRTRKLGGPLGSLNIFPLLVL